MLESSGNRKLWGKDNELRGMEAFRTFMKESETLSHKSVLKVDVP